MAVGAAVKPVGKVAIPPTRIERIAISRLKPSPYNPRKMNPHAAAGLGNSIEKFGVVQPLVWNARSGYVVGGHQRLKDVKKKGFKGTDLLDVVVVDLDDSDEKALNIALNSPALAGEFDGRLADLLAELQTRDDDLFERLHLDDLLDDAERARKQHVSFDVNPAGTNEVGDFVA